MFVEVRSGVLEGDFSAGAFTKKAFQQGEVVIDCHTLSPVPSYTTEKSYLTIQVSDTEHVLIARPAVCINHSCNPNVWINPNVEPICFVAIRDIAENEELFFNYASTEWEMIQPFNCQCKSEKCLGYVAGAKFLSQSQASAIAPFCSDFMKSKLNSAFPSVVIRTGVLEGTEHSSGVFATKKFGKGEVVINCSTISPAPIFTTEKTYLTIQIGDGRHVLVARPAVVINHSCKPNVAINPCQQPIVFKALREIEEGEELFFNYTSTEWEMIEPFPCQCKSDCCMGDIRGAKFGTPSQVEMIRPTCSDFILEKLAAAAAGVEVRSGVLSGDFSSGVFASRGFAKDELVLDCTTLHPPPIFTKEKTYLTIQVSEHGHVLVAKPAVMINHGCEPNVYINPCTNPITFRALRDIAPNEELFFNYTSTEWEMIQPFNCQCKAPTCFGEVRGAKYLTPSQALAVRNYCSDFIATKLSEKAARGVEIRQGVLVGEFSSGVYTTQPFRKGETVIDCSALFPAPQPSKEKTYLTIQVSDQSHVLVSRPAVVVNHSCQPNLVINPCADPITFTALRDIAPNEELFFNYLTTEWEMIQPFPCQCKSSACFGEIRGAKYLNGGQASALLPLCSDFIQRMLHKQHAECSEFGGVEVKNGGVYTTRDFNKGDILINTEALEPRVILRNATYQTIELADGKHLLLPRPAVHMNHSCSPSTTLTFGSPITVRALYDLPKGSEVTFNYVSTEFDMDQPFTCLCHKEGCYGVIRGFKHLSSGQQAAVVGALEVTPCIQAKYELLQQTSTSSVDEDQHLNKRRIIA